MKELAKQLFLKIGGDNFLRSINRRPRVLFWHGVHKNPDPNVEAESIDKCIFKLQIEYLINNFEIISIEEFYKRLINKSFTNKEVVLTFDDGYKNNLYTLAPIMKMYNLPFTVFISTNNITKNELYPTSIARLAIYGSKKRKLKIDELKKTFDISSEKSRNETSTVISSHLKNLNHNLATRICNDIRQNFNLEEWSALKKEYNGVEVLSWDEVKKLVENYKCTIGSHCMDHICCHENQDLKEVNNQILKSKKIIETELNTDCDYFAFPNGNYTELSKLAVKNAGYKLGFSTGNGKIKISNADFSAIPRISIPFKLSTFKIITNLYPW